MSSGRLQLRPTRPDHPQIVALLGALDTYLASLYAPEDNHILDVEALLAPEVLFVAAWNGDQAVGCGAVRCMPGEPATGGRAYGEIKRMYVDPAHRGQRIGEQLLTALERALSARGLALSLLETGRDQREAVRLYERCGYAVRAAFGGYPDNGLSVFYQRQLGP